jgi:adenylosuccinate lyase
MVQTPMIPRYTPADFAALWSPARRYAAWLEVELAACDRDGGGGPRARGHRRGSARGRASVLDPERIEAIEAETRHDVIAFLTHVEELAGPPARWLHRGMTSSDVLDTSLAMLLRDAADLPHSALESLLDALRAAGRGAPRHGDDRALARHPRRAHHLRPQVLAGHYAEFVRCHAPPRRRARRDRRGHHLRRRGHDGAPVARRRGRRPRLRWACARDGAHAGGPARPARGLLRRARVVAGAIERLAVQVRHWQRTEVLEAEEPFARAEGLERDAPQAQPHRLGEPLRPRAHDARLRGRRAENAALWHERDISHSSAERMIAPDATTTLGSCSSAPAPRRGPRGVPREHARPTSPRAGPCGPARPCCSRWWHAGCARQQAYVWVQRNAMKAWRGEGDFRALLGADDDVRARRPPRRSTRASPARTRCVTCDALIDRALRCLRALASGAFGARRRGQHTMIDDARCAPRWGSRWTHVELFRARARYRGKVRDNLTPPDGRRVLVTTDRISAFDRVLGTCRSRGRCCRWARGVLVSRRPGTSRRITCSTRPTPT